MRDHMEYYEGMEQIDSDIMEQVLHAREQYQPEEYTGRDVLRALQHDVLNADDFAALLSPMAGNYLEQMAQRAREETRRHFGSSVCLFTPLYLANYCENQCVYCGFNCKNKIHRAKLTEEEIESEYRAIAETGLREILLLTGESRNASSVAYIARAVELAQKYFSNIGIEIYPLNSDEYAILRQAGADFVSVYQETYDTKKYGEVHLGGPKRSFPYRFHAQERALLGGMRGVAFGALLGLSDFRRDAFSAGLHATLIQKKYPQAEISFSLPRIRPFVNNPDRSANDVGERELLQVMLAYRLLAPYAGITISTRECARFRDGVVGLAATKISAGVKVGVGGHVEEEKGDEQFDISDPRDVREVHQMIVDHGLQPVYRDYIRV